AHQRRRQVDDVGIEEEQEVIQRRVLRADGELAAAVQQLGAQRNFALHRTYPALTPTAAERNGEALSAERPNWMRETQTAKRHSPGAVCPDRFAAAFVVPGHPVGMTRVCPGRRGFLPRNLLRRWMATADVR